MRFGLFTAVIFLWLEENTKEKILLGWLCICVDVSVLVDDENDMRMHVRKFLLSQNSTKSVQLT